MSANVVWAIVFGSIFGMVLSACGIFFTTWQFWVLIIVAGIGSAISAAVQRIWGGF